VSTPPPGAGGGAEREKEIAALRARVAELEQAQQRLNEELAARRGDAGLLKSLWRGLPVPWSWRKRFKTLVFRALAPLLRHTNAYRRWEAQGGGARDWEPDANRVRAANRRPAFRPQPVPIATTPVDPAALRAKAIAFYLPQFHPIPENDAWWGRGFTEWTNVSKAQPQFSGHEQPHLPGELGFYDLRLPQVMERQVELARLYGVHAFCFHYYWFDGRRVLERPLDMFLDNAALDFPFCICWANENWTRRWDGHDHDILLGQSHSPDSDLHFIRDVEPLLRDPRYLRVDGKPLLIVYRPSLLPDAAATTRRWREYCRASGLGEIHRASVRFWDALDARALGFDAAVDFPPHHIAVRNLTAEMPGLAPGFEGLVYDYEHAVRENLASRGHGYDQLAHRGVMLAWDNTARRGLQAHIAHGATPEIYRTWIEGVLEQEMELASAPESLVFINAWNEWGEGATLEPDLHFGHGFLEATRDALRSVQERWGGRR
jgi:lipopolysaccharide biosynthesis protein